MPAQPSPPPQHAAPGPVRAAVERASLPALRALGRLPVWVPFLVVLVLILGGGWLGGPVGIAAIALALLAVTWLLYLSWPRLTGVERLMRLTVLALVLAVAATRIVPG